MLFDGSISNIDVAMYRIIFLYIEVLIDQRQITIPCILYRYRRILFSYHITSLKYPHILVQTLITIHAPNVDILIT